MKVTTQNLENNLVKIIVEIDNAEFKKECTNVYNLKKSKYNIPGFRKGHADQKTIERYYGETVFFEDACNNCINNTCDDAIKESKAEIISRPQIEVTQIDKSQNLIYEITIAVKPEFTVANYKGLELTKMDIAVTDEDIENRLKQEQEKNAELETKDSEIVNGDTAIIDFEGFVDGVAFEGGKGENFSLGIGTHTFVDNFEDQLIGHKTGDEVEVKIHFPKQYQEDLADKDALFKVVVKDVKTKKYPELNDEFASMVSEFEKLEDLKESYKKEILEDKEKEAQSKLENDAIKSVVENTELVLPKEAIETEVDALINDMRYQLDRQGISFDQYMKFIRKTPEEFRKMNEPEAIKNLKTRVVLEKIATIENVSASDEMLEEELLRISKKYNTPIERIKEVYTDEQKESIRGELLYRAVVRYILENAKIK